MASLPAVMALYAMAFFSGAAALIYEVTWARMLGLTFGSATLSAAAVIAGFMGGMGLGAWLYHHIYDRTSRALVIYSVLELGIAITTALLTRTFYHLPGMFADLSGVVSAGPWLTLTRLVWVLVLLVIPAALMGATFPALCTVMIRTVRGVDRHLGMIYGINTIGAAAGALLAGLILIERFGLTDTVSVGNAFNVAVALAALALRGTALGRGDVRAAPPAESAIPTYLPQGLTGAVLFVSGFATLSYEVLWFRALRFMVGNSTYALTLVLVIFLVGLGLGSLLLGRVVRRRSPERDLALCQCTIAVLALAAMTCLWLVVTFPVLRDQVNVFSLEVRYRPWQWRLLLAGSLATLTMLPATLFMGLSFPLASRMFLGDVRKLGTRVGGAYLLANLGSILGALVAAVLLLPRFGTIGGTKLVSGINLALGVAVLLGIRQRTTGWARPALAALILVAVMAVALPASLTRLGDTSRQLGGDSVVVYAEDGDLASVQVLEDPNDPAKKSMIVDGAPIGYSRGHRTHKLYQKQVVLAHLPMALDTRIRTTLNVGLGSGSTLDTLATYPELEALDCVEISRAVVHAAQLFPESAVLDDPRVELIVDDAVHFLLRSGRNYDLIISDGKQDPMHSGNATLLCREFYQNSFARLTETGIFIEWFTLAKLHSEFRVNLRTVCAVFPYVEVFWFGPHAFVLGAGQPIFDRPRRAERLAMPPAAGSVLAAFFLDHTSALLAGWSSGKPQLQRVLGDGPISTWDHLLTDFTSFKATREQWSGAWGENIALLLGAEKLPRPEAESFELPEPGFRESRALLRRAFAQVVAGNNSAALELSQQAVQINPADRDYAQAMLAWSGALPRELTAEQLLRLGTELAQQDKLEQAIAYLTQSLKIEPGNVAALNNLGLALVKQGQLAEAITHFNKALQIQPDNSLAHHNLGYLYERQDKLDEAARHYAALVRIDPGLALAQQRWGIVLGRQGKFQEALERFSAAARIKPNDGQLRCLMGEALEAQGRIREAVAEYREALRLAPGQLQVLSKLAWILATHHDPAVRNGEEAVKYGELACEGADYKSPAMLDSLAAAYAEAGRFAEAVKTARAALSLAGEAQRQQLATEIRARLELYQAGQAYRTAP